MAGMLLLPADGFRAADSIVALLTWTLNACLCSCLFMLLSVLVRPQVYERDLDVKAFREAAGSTPFKMRLEASLSEKSSNLRKLRGKYTQKLDTPKMRAQKSRDRTTVNDFYIQQMGDGPLPNDDADCDAMLDSMLQDLKVDSVPCRVLVQLEHLQIDGYCPALICPGSWSLCVHAVTSDSMLSILTELYQCSSAHFESVPCQVYADTQCADSRHCASRQDIAS
jgi:hypothetical protein